MISLVLEDNVILDFVALRVFSLSRIRWKLGWVGKLGDSLNIFTIRFNTTKEHSKTKLLQARMKSRHLRVTFATPKSQITSRKRKLLSPKTNRDPQISSCVLRGKHFRRNWQWTSFCMQQVSCRFSVKPSRCAGSLGQQHREYLGAVPWHGKQI